MIQILFVIGLVCIDQIIKYWALVNLKQRESIIVIENFFNLTYVENRGAAFGILQGAIPILAFFTLVILVILIRYYRSLSKNFPNKYIKISILFIIAGAIGNLIDRVFRTFVVDMLQFTFIDFPVFNVADMYVVVSCIAMVIITIFFIKEDNNEK